MKGYSLLELLLTMVVVSAMFYLSAEAFSFYSEGFTQGNRDQTLQVELQNAMEMIKEDMRDASAIGFPPQICCPVPPERHLVRITRADDGLTYTYYLSGSNSLVRAEGTGFGALPGTTVANNLDRDNTSITRPLVGIYAVELAANDGGQQIEVRTTVEPRNFP